MFDLANTTVIMLALAAFAAGFVDSIVPALLLAGFTPVQALATNKLQGMFGSGSATIHYASKGHVDLRRQLPSALLALIGSAIGALLATIVPGDLLRALLPIVLIAIAIYFAVKPNMNDVDRAERLSPFLFGLTIVPAVGFYVALAGYGVLKATAHTKLLNFASNIGGFIVFAAFGVVYWKIGLMMGVAQFLGARLGASLAMRIGAKLIKPLLVIVCLALAVKLLADPTNPLRALIAGM